MELKNVELSSMKNSTKMWNSAVWSLKKCVKPFKTLKNALKIHHNQARRENIFGGILIKPPMENCIKNVELTS